MAAPLCFSSATAPPDISPLSLHDALPISGFFLRAARPPKSQSAESRGRAVPMIQTARLAAPHVAGPAHRGEDRKSTRLNSSHPSISYAVFCLKKKKNTERQAAAWKLIRCL